MKKIQIVMVIVLIIFNSCSKDDIQNDHYTQSQIDQVLNSRGKIQKNSYLLLDNELKYQLWTDKLNNVKFDLNQEQKEVIDELLTILEPDFFKIDTPNNPKYKEKIQRWKLKAQSVFKRKEFITTFTKLNNSDLELKTDEESEEAEECECNRFEDYCWFSDCDSSGCSSQEGCGILWGNRCNGECD